MPSLSDRLRAIDVKRVTDVSPKYLLGGNPVAEANKVIQEAADLLAAASAPSTPKPKAQPKPPVPDDEPEAL